MEEEVTGANSTAGGEGEGSQETFSSGNSKKGKRESSGKKWQTRGRCKETEDENYLQELNIHMSRSKLMWSRTTCSILVECPALWASGSAPATC